MKNSLSALHTQASHPSYTVQFLAEDDIPHALALIEKVRTSQYLGESYHLKPKTHDDLSTNLENGFPLLGIKSTTGDLIAFTMVCPLDKEVILLKSVCVDLDYDIKGRGSAMIRAASDWACETWQQNGWAAENGSPHLVAKVAMDNIASLSMFEKQGFDKSLSATDSEGYKFCFMFKRIEQKLNPKYKNNVSVFPDRTVR